MQSHWSGVIAQARGVEDSETGRWEQGLSACLRGEEGGEMGGVLVKGPDEDTRRGRGIGCR